MNGYKQQGKEPKRNVKEGERPVYEEKRFRPCGQHQYIDKALQVPSPRGSTRCETLRSRGVSPCWKQLCNQQRQASHSHALCMDEAYDVHSLYQDGETL